MNIVTLELLAGPAPTQADSKEQLRYMLRRARVMGLEQQRRTAYYVRLARQHGLPNREIGEILGHSEGWVRQYAKDTAGKTEVWDFADDGFRANAENHIRFYEDLTAAKGLDQQLHLCAEYGLTDTAVASVLSIPPGRVPELMEVPRAEAAA